MDELEKDMLKIVSLIVEIDEDELLENRRRNLFEELGIDSLAGLEIIAAIEKKYKIEIREDRLQEIVTLEKAINLVRELTPGKMEVVS